MHCPYNVHVYDFVIFCKFAGILPYFIPESVYIAVYTWLKSARFTFICLHILLITTYNFTFIKHVCSLHLPWIA